MDKLELILSRLDELTQITKAIRDRQDETDAKLEALAMDLHKSRGEISEFRDETSLNFKKMDRRVKLIESDLDETMLRVEKQ